MCAFSIESQCHTQSMTPNYLTGNKKGETKEANRRQRNGPKDIQVFILRTSECYLFGRKDFADMIDLRVLRQGDYPRSSRQTLNVVTVSL